MKKIALLLLLAASFSMPAFAADGAEPIKLISYNLRTSHGKDGDNVWMKRRHATPEMIRREAPDVFGVQEGLIDQLHYIDTECPQYARVGVGRDDGAEKGEFMAVYYLRDRFELLDSGTFWLSETPDKVSRGWDGACNRTVTWVELKDRKSGKEFFYFNTHLDHKGKAAREEGVKLLIEKIHEIAGKKTPAILGGEIGRASRMVHHDELHGSRAGGITRLQPTGVSDRILRTVAHGQDALRIAGTRHGDAGKLRFGEHPPFGQIGIETPLGKFGIGPERNGHAHSTGRTAVEMHTPGEAQRRHSQRIETLSAVVVSVPRQQVRIFAVHAPIDQTPGMGRTPPGRQHLRTFGAIGFEQEGLAAGEDELRAVVLQH